MTDNSIQEGPDRRPVLFLRSTNLLNLSNDWRYLPGLAKLIRLWDLISAKIVVAGLGTFQNDGVTRNLSNEILTFAPGNLGGLTSANGGGSITQILVRPPAPWGSNSSYARLGDGNAVGE